MRPVLKPLSVTRDMIPYTVGAAVAVGLKYLYSRSLCDDLVWVLGPTARLVSWLTGFSFVRDSLAGFVNADLGIAIAPACSGVNFMIIAYAMAFFSFAHHYQTALGKWAWMGMTFLCAYVLTLAVNSVRICLSIATISHDLHVGWLTPARIHRIEGVGVYFFFLCLFYYGINFLMARYSQKTKPTVSRTAFFMMGPLTWYLAVALLVPILTGHYRDQQGRFIEHGLMVMMSCTCVLAVIAGMRRFILSAMGPSWIKQAIKKN